MNIKKHRKHRHKTKGGLGFADLATAAAKAAAGNPKALLNVAKDAVANPNAVLNAAKGVAEKAIGNQADIANKLKGIADNAKNAAQTALGNKEDIANKLNGFLVKAKGAVQNATQRVAPAGADATEIAKEQTESPKQAAQEIPSGPKDEKTETGKKEVNEETEESKMTPEAKALEEERKTTIGYVFANILYKNFALACLAGVSLLLLISMYDFVKVIYDKITLQNKFDRDFANVFTKDTSDYKSLNYIGTDPDQEPYNIFLQQKIILYILIVVASCVILFAVQLSLLFGTTVLRAFKKKFDKNGAIGNHAGENDSPATYIDKDTFRYLIPIIATGIVLIVLSTFYKRNFINNAQNKVKNIRNQMRNIKRFVYAYLTKNEKFLNAIQNDDLKSIIYIIQSTINKDNGNDCAANNDGVGCGNDSEARKMLFTYSLYSYFKFIVSENDDYYMDVMSLFNINNITNTQEIDPAQYFYYKENVNVKNLYAIMRSDITGDTSPNGTPSTFITQDEDGNDIFDAERESQFNSQLDNMFQNLNANIIKTNKLVISRAAVSTYIYSYFGLTLLAFIVVLLASWRNVSDPIINGYTSVKNFIITILTYIKKYISELINNIQN